jgi:signal transduction histidine kinase
VARPSHGPVRRRAPQIVAAALALLLVWYVLYTQRVVNELRREAERSSLMYARIYSALSDSSQGAADAALLDLSGHIRDMGVPVVVTDMSMRPTYAANLPFQVDRIDSPRVVEYARALDRINEPVVEPGVGMVHFGNTPLVFGLRVIPIFQAAMIGLLLVAMVYMLRTRGSAERERIWAGMARESAHQLGTPISSISGWVELLRERSDDDPLIASAVANMEGDLERLERVAHRFERIGRPPKREDLDAAQLVEKIASYFSSRVPTLARSVAVAWRAEGPLMVLGDRVLLEWALEVLVKNSVDALAGRGGRILLTAERVDQLAPVAFGSLLDTGEHSVLPTRSAVRIRVADDGPGIPRELRARVFDPGFSTKSSGWGIGLSLARRIVEEGHGGRLVLVPVDRGAAFDVILPA